MNKLNKTPKNFGESDIFSEIFSEKKRLNDVGIKPTRISLGYNQDKYVRMIYPGYGCKNHNKMIFGLKSLVVDSVDYFDMF